MSRPSIWTDSEPALSHPPLSTDASCDAVVIGAGIAGVTTAYLLAAEGRRVVLLDALHVGAGMTCMTTAHLVSAIDDRFRKLIQLHGLEAAKTALAAHAGAVDFIERTVAAESIECDFTRLPGYLFLAAEQTRKELDDELEAAKECGAQGVRRLDRPPLETFDLGPCIEFPAQGQFHPLKYVDALVRALEERGAAVHGGTRVVSSEEKDGRVRVKTESGLTIDAGVAVFATNSPVNDRVAIHSKQAPYMTHVVAAPVDAAAVPKALFWDMGDPYHYIRTWTDGAGRTLLVSGGEDFKSGHGCDTRKAFDALEAWTRRRFPSFGDVAYRWSGQVMEPVDGLAYLGRNPGDERTFVVTGDSGMGMTHGTAGALIIQALAAGREHPWAKAFDPSRKTLKSAGTYVAENLHVVEGVLAHAAPGDEPSADDVPAGHGAIVRHGLKQCAVYRDDQGALHEMSATCPHLGCVVAWNDSDRTWDCPCHGSRFAATGEVVNGPAVSGLARHET